MKQIKKYAQKKLLVVNFLNIFHEISFTLILILLFEHY